MTTFKPSATQTFFSIATCLQLGVAFRFGLTQGLKALLVCSFLGVSMASAGSSDLIDGPPRLSVGIAASVPSSAPVRLAPRLAQSSHGTHPGKRRAGNILLATGLISGLVIGPTITAAGWGVMMNGAGFMDDQLFFVGAGVTLTGLLVALIGGVIVATTPRARPPRAKFQVRVAPTLEKRSRGVALLGRF